MINRPRYDFATKRAFQFLLDNDITSFPYDIKQIVKDNDWGLYSYSELETIGMSSYMAKRLYGKDGRTSPENGGYIILYNDDPRDVVMSRIIFTIAHEIGHIYLDHFVDYNTANLTKEEYDILDCEAQCFARNILIPASVVQAIPLNSAWAVSQYFGVSLAAARTRMSLLNNDLFYLPHTEQSIQRTIFDDYINDIFKDIFLGIPRSEIAATVDFSFLL